MSDRDINIEPDRPAVRGTRVAVDFVLELMADGWTPQEIVRHFGHITGEDPLRADEPAPVRRDLHA